jgi:hypothetical protein
MFNTMRRAERERRLQIFETNYGCDVGWFVEHQGRRVAQLTDPRYADQFWLRYRIEPLTGDLAEREELLNSPDPWISCDFVYRSRRFGEVAELAFSAGQPVGEPGRVLMRALYLAIDGPSLWERVLLWKRRSRGTPCQP